MKENKDLDELIISYLLNELDSEDEAYLTEHINSDKDRKKYFDEFRNTIRLLSIQDNVDKIDVSSEWNRFAQLVAKDNPLLAPATKKESLKGVTISQPDDAGVARLRRMIVAMAVAAAALAFIIILPKQHMLIQQSAGKRAYVQASVPAIKESIVRHEVNSSGKRKRVSLQDGSEVVLYDKSEVTFTEPFSGNRRDITLKGKASFKVAKDKTRPFTVYSFDLATTALGTVFTVTAFENAAEISVRLYEGKVVIKSSGKHQAKLLHDYYLNPGQQLVYNNLSCLAKMSEFNLAGMLPLNEVKAPKSREDPQLPENLKGSWNMFNNQSLAHVFDQLKILYNTDIRYSPQDLKNMYFIGKLETSDSLSLILNKITSLNNLKLVKTDSAYIITR
jgi:transmembrane sensor